MKHLISLIAFGILTSAGGAFAATDPAATAKPAVKTKQQGKMVTCNKNAKEKQLKGPERRQFMSTCLKA